jgi:drug/metabolite transporter (DMT)-like permease
MIGAVFTSVLFAVNAVFARRSALLLGSTAANWWRLALAAVILGAWAGTGGRGHGLVFEWFLLSGVAGFGLGGLAMFHALPRAGSNVAMLIVQCGSALVALVLEWAWLGTRLGPVQAGAVAVIVAGVAIGLAPQAWPRLPKRQLAIGAVLAAVSAVGQGAGAVLSRQAFAVARALEGAGAVDPGTAAFERALGGLLVATLALAPAWVAARGIPRVASPGGGGAAWPWVVANALAGPVLGVACFQWALGSTPAPIVQSIVATTPLLTAPFAWRLGEGVPRARYFVGAAAAVAGTAALFLERLLGG